MAVARTKEDWRKLASELAPAIKSIADGSQPATAAQASMLKEIMARAYGKPVATQEENKVASGLIVLPTLDSGEKTMVCPRCGYDVTQGLEGSKFVKPENTVATESGAAISLPSIDS